MIAIFFILSVLLPVLASPTAVFTTPTGRHIPLPLLQSLLPRLSLHSLHTRVYELTDTHVTGPGLSIRLPTTPPVPAPQFTSVLVDGRPTRPPSVSIRRGNRLAVAVSSSGRTLAIWGPNLNLLPVHTTLHPTLFLNMNSAPSRPLSFDDDALAIPSPNATARFPLSQPAVATVSSGPCARNAVVKTVEVAMAYDSEFCARYADDSSDASATITAMLDEATTAFRTTCVEVVASFLHGTCNSELDPYRDMHGNLLEAFRHYWVTSMQHVKRDIAFFISGNEDNTTSAGRAYLRATCNTDYGYGWAEGNNAVVLAHELGHSLGAEHTTSGLMQATLSFSAELEFSDISVDQISAFMDSNGPGTACLASKWVGTDPPPTSSSPREEPPSVAGTCSSGFSASNLMSCMPWLHMADVKTNLGEVSIHMRQFHGEFRLRLESKEDDGSGDLRMKKVKVRLSGKSTGTGATRGMDSDDGVVRWDEHISPKELSMPDWWQSCCGRELELSVEVVMKRTIEFAGFQFTPEATVRRDEQWLVFCEDACKGRTGTAVIDSASRCPVCRG